MRGPQPRVAVATLTLCIAATGAYGAWRTLDGRPGNEPARAREQLARGEVIYSRRCSHCHDAANGIGPRLEPAVIAAYRSARRLFDYIRLAMPYDAAGSLDETEYWDVVAYLLHTRNLLAAGRLISAGSADRIRFAYESVRSPQ